MRERYENNNDNNNNKNIYDELGIDYVNKVCEDDDNTRPQSLIVNSETGINDSLDGNR